MFDREKPEWIEQVASSLLRDYFDVGFQPTGQCKYEANYECCWSDLEEDGFERVVVGVEPEVKLYSQRKLSSLVSRKSHATGTKKLVISSTQ